MTILYFLKRLLSVLVHCSFGLQGELCLINHALCHGPMNQASISSVSACICSTALPYPQAAAFTPFSAHSSHLCHTFGWRTWCSSSFFSCNTASIACAGGRVMNTTIEQPELHYGQRESSYCICLRSNPNVCPCGFRNLCFWSVITDLGSSHCRSGKCLSAIVSLLSPLCAPSLCLGSYRLHDWIPYTWTCSL